MGTHVGERVLSSRGRGDGPLQQPGQQGPHQVLRLVGQLGVAGDVGDGHHDVLSDDLEPLMRNINIMSEIVEPPTDL